MACVPSEDSDQPGIHPVWSDSSLCAQWSILHADSEDWSNWTNAQADLILRWTHMPFCRFCHALAQVSLFILHVLYYHCYSSLTVKWTKVIKTLTPESQCHLRNIHHLKPVYGNCSQHIVLLNIGTGVLIARESLKMTPVLDNHQPV